VVWSWLKWEKPPHRVSLGRGGGGLDGASYHGLLQERWHTIGGAHDDGARAIPKGGEAQAAESVGDELETPKVMVSLREKPSHGEHSPPVVVMNADDGIIGTV
jgi:hypothetical protein